MSAQASSVLGSVLAALTGALVGLSVALVRTRERVARLEAITEFIRGDILHGKAGVK